MILATTASSVGPGLQIARYLTRNDGKGLGLSCRLGVCGAVRVVAATPVDPALLTR
jgi:hypothetical protein